MPPRLKLSRRIYRKMAENFVFGLIGKEDISFGYGSFAPTLPDGSVGALSKVNLSALYPNYTKAFSATPTWDLEDGVVQTMELTGDVTASAITNGGNTPPAGARLVLRLVQDDTGGRTVVWPSNVSGTTIVIDTAIDAVTIAELMFNGTTWEFMNPTALHGWRRSSTNVILSTITDSVGIGIASPAVKLHVKGADETLRVESTTTTVLLDLYTSAGKKGELSATGTALELLNGAGQYFQLTTDYNFGFGLASYGGGQKVLAVGDAVVQPASSPVGGGLLYSVGGELKWKSSGGTVSALTPVAAAGVTGSGTTTRIPRFSSSTALQDSALIDDGTDVTTARRFMTDAAGNNVLELGASTRQWGIVWSSTFKNSTGSMTFEVTTANAMVFNTDSTTRWQISATGHLLPFAASTYDIGSVGSPVRNIYADTYNGSVIISGISNTRIVWSSGGNLTGNGDLTWTNTTSPKVLDVNGEVDCTTLRPGQVWIGGVLYTLSVDGSGFVKAA